MPTRTSRSGGASAKGTRTGKAGEPKQLSSPPATPTLRRSSRKSGGSSVLTPKSAGSTRRGTPASKKRSYSTSAKDEGPRELPHNLGKEESPLSSNVAEVEDSPAPPKKKPRVKKEDRDVSLHKLSSESPQKKPRTQGSVKQGKDSGQSAPSARSKGDWPWRTDPYPKWPHPTPEEAHEVHRILTEIHGRRAPPPELPKPSLMVAGCGQVKSILDALIRTLLSANTSRENAGRALQGLVKRFGVLEKGIGKGSVDWNAVRLADVSDVREAIHHGGMADKKSKYIKQMLDVVYAENQERAEQLRNMKSDPSGAGEEDEESRAAELEIADQKVLSLQHVYLLDDEDAFESLRRFEGIGVKTAACVLLFSLRRPCFAVDTHVYRLCRWLGWVPPPEWVKEQNKIAADKHRANVSRKKAGDSPKKERFKGMPSVDRDPTFYHCDVTVPDELKYGLHALMIDHGRNCPRCRANTGEGSRDWNKGCKLEKLLSRDGSRKGGPVAEASASSEDDDAVSEEWEEDDEDD